MQAACRSFGIRPPSSNNTKGLILDLHILYVKYMVYVSLYSSLSASFCSSISDMHLVLLPLHNIGFDEYTVTY